MNQQGSHRQVAAPASEAVENNILYTRSEGVDFGRMSNIGAAAEMFWSALRNNMDVYQKVQQTKFDWDVATELKKQKADAALRKKKAESRQNYEYLTGLYNAQLQGLLTPDQLKMLTSSYWNTRTVTSPTEGDIQ